jgi:ketosteroid isomerase-like protein
VVRRYAAASAAGDHDALERLRHPDWCTFWPQSGERVRGTRNFAEIAANYPGGLPTIELERIAGTEDRWVVTPGNTVARVAGSGDLWWGEWRMTYPDGKTYWSVTLLELRDGRIWRETTYWAEPFEAPDWRSPWVERDASAG